MNQQAIIYARVSSQKQVTEGNGLASQETRCRDYAKHKGYEVIEVFRDEGLSGKLMDRPNMHVMLKYLKRNRGLVVIIDDISRLARDIETHIHLRTAISKNGGKLESPSIEFGDDSDSKLVEHLLASVAAHQRDKNAEQTTNRMMARMQNGYHCFNPMPGYVFKRVAGHGKLLTRDEPVASVIQQALERFACGQFETASELKRFFEATPCFPKDRKGKVHYSRIKDILTSPLYAGLVHKPEWGIHMQKGQHEGLISIECWQRVQQRLTRQAKVPARKDISNDFPLRGFIICDCCGSHMSSCWTHGRSAKYPYYFCTEKTCTEYKKSIKREAVEGDFAVFLEEMTPAPAILKLAAKMFHDTWEAYRGRIKEQATDIRLQVAQIERKVDQLMERLVEADNVTVITAYENKLRTLEEEKLFLDEKLAQSGRPLQSFKETFRTAFAFLSNPQILWHSDRLDHKRTVLKLVFGEKLRYCKKQGFRTAATPLPLLLTGGIDDGKSEMVRPAGLEPATYCLEGSCSIQLS